ncbi:hypothetical protein N657DRAFT_630064 [Parathielavia appendiculata]|uniref:BZIP transcription factor n=1 Tax=Parathielavia appendiculata TaxID=2587402 RepID=A0AAN6UAU5_9PEZI|nr:hypothetical protein N657DRAFT_630064 [Parathielavia appendiculata]
MGDTSPHKASSPDWSDASSSGSYADHIYAPKPMRPKLPSRKSSGTMIVPRDSSDVGPVELHVGPDDVRSMSPRRTTEDIQTLGKQAREELQRATTSKRKTTQLTAARRHAKALQDSLINIFNRIEAVKEEHDKLDNHNKFLQKYIGDLMSTSKITSTSRSKK